MSTKLRDVIAAEELLEAAEADYRRLNDNPSEWSAWESLDKRGKRTLNVLPGHFERRQAAIGRVRAAQQQLLAAKRGFMAGVVDHAAI